MARMEQILILGRHARFEAKIKIKTPLVELKIIHKEKKMLKEIAKLEPFIQSELNVKKISYDTEEEKHIRLYAKPNFPILGKRFGKEMKKFKALIEGLSSEALAAFEDAGSLTLDGEKLSGEEIQVMREALPNTGALSNRWITIELDTRLTDDLVQEGLAREIVSHIQRLRKEKGFHVADHISVGYSGDASLEKVLQKYSDYVCQETLTEDLKQNPRLQNSESVKIDDNNLNLQLERRGG